MSAQPLSVLMVSYNTCPLTLAAIASVYQNTRTPLELFVVDNASSDGSADAIAAAFPSVKLIRSERNLGFGAACNLAAQQAAGERLLLLNPDTEVLPGAIDRLMAFANRTPDAGIWGGRTLNRDGSLNPSSCWRRQTLWGLACAATGLSALWPRSGWLNPDAYGGWLRDSEREVDVVSGCFLLIDRALWDALDGFAPVFFMYGEDADLCLRARRLGARPRITPLAEIIHEGGASEAVRADKIVRLYRAKAQLMHRHWSAPACLVGRALMQLNVARRWLWFSLRRFQRRAVEQETNPFGHVWARRDDWLRDL